MRLRFSIRVKHGPALTGASPSVESPVEHAIVVAADDAIVIGRRPGVAIQLPFAGVSGEHARIVREERGWLIEDLGSANGTCIGERRVRARMPTAIAAGDAIRIGGVEIRFDGETAAQDSDSSGTATLARRLVHDVFQALPPAEKPRLVVLAGPAAGRELSLAVLGRPMKLGRGDGCDWVVPDNDISREHATFERGPDGIVVRDLGSKNGLLVDGIPVADSQALHDGDTIALGKTRLQVVDPEERYLRRMEQLNAAEPAPPAPETTAKRSSLPTVATTIAATTLLLCLGLVLALVFFAKV